MGEYAKAAVTLTEEMEERVRVEVKNKMKEIMSVIGGNPSHHSVARLVKDSESPMSLLVQSFPILHKFKLSTLESYDSSSDSVDHWQHCLTMMGLQDVPDAIMCRSFATTLKGIAQMWYNHLPPSSIHDFQEFGTKFIPHFMGGINYSKLSAHFFTIKQKSNESLKITIIDSIKKA